MKRFENKEMVLTKECVELQCDLCGRKAEFPANEVWEWGSVGSAKGELIWFYTIDGELVSETIDLCYDCAEKIGERIRTSPKSFLEGLKQ
jgi:hypothetical protein